MVCRPLTRLGPVACLVGFALIAAGCSDSAPAPVQRAQIDESQSPDPGFGAGGATTGIVVLGDSLTAGLGVLEEESFPARLQALFIEEGYEEVEVINAGISGDTTAGGLRRVDSLITPDVKVAIVALGGNDALRGLSVADTKRNLQAIISRFLDSGVSVVLAGMEGPTNLGEDYRAGFRNAFRELASEYGAQIRFVPFLLEGVAGMPALNQADGIHPNPEGAQMIADLLHPTVRDLVDQIPEGPITR